MKDSTRLFERIGDYRKALQRVHEVLVLSENDVVRDSLIQRFEFTYELAWKTMKLWLEFKDIETRSPQEALGEALRVGIIEDGNGWTRMQKERNQTSHTYNESTAIEVALFVRTEAIVLLDALDRRLDEIVKAG